MATWVTHLMIADGVLREMCFLDRRGFCAGNIAPDCNVENADWSSFTPSREVTHWMSGNRKVASDCESFCKKYILNSKDTIDEGEQASFLLGYYSHLITDASFQAMIRNSERVKSVWNRIKQNYDLFDISMGVEESWDSVKKLIPAQKRMQDIYTIEAEYLNANPNSGYLTEILPLKIFPNYIDYLPEGAIVRKIGVMGYIPKTEENNAGFIAISRDEYSTFIRGTTELVISKIERICEIMNWG